MSIVNASLALANGLRMEFTDTYLKALKRASDSRLSIVMDGIGATNRRHEFAYPNSAGHLEYWPRGTTIPTEAFDYTQFSVSVYEFAKRVPWSKWDRKDDQTDSLIEMARAAGASAGLLEERIFFDLITAGTNMLPAAPNAPDGKAMFSATGPGTADRFGISGGNIVTQSGIATITQVQTDYYNGLIRMTQFQDGKGQPLHAPETVSAGVLIIFPIAYQKLFEEAFIQKTQGMGIAGTSAYGPTSVAAAGVTNVVLDASRNVQLWPTTRLSGDDWYMFLMNPPKKPTFALDREGVREFSSLEGDNNSDHTRDTGEEYIQWERRIGGGISLPYAAVKIA